VYKEKEKLSAYHMTAGKIEKQLKILNK